MMLSWPPLGDMINHTAAHCTSQSVSSHSAPPPHTHTHIPMLHQPYPAPHKFTTFNTPASTSAPPPCPACPACLPLQHRICAALRSSTRAHLCPLPAFAAQNLEGYQKDEWVIFERALIVRDLYTGGVRTFLSRKDARQFRAAVYSQYGGSPAPPVVGLSHRRAAPCCRRSIPAAAAVTSAHARPEHLPAAVFMLHVCHSPHAALTRPALIIPCHRPASSRATRPGATHDHLPAQARQQAHHQRGALPEPAGKLWPGQHSLPLLPDDAAACRRRAHVCGRPVHALPAAVCWHGDAGLLLALRSVHTSARIQCMCQRIQLAD
jgi:hypothetical protein